MCGFSFRKANSIEGYFERSHTRGTDGLGGVYKGRQFYAFSEVPGDFSSSIGGSDFTMTRTALNTHIKGYQSALEHIIGAINSGVEDIVTQLTGDIPSNNIKPNTTEQNGGKIFTANELIVDCDSLGEDYVLFHHRKTSIGKRTIENVHPFPFFDGRYLLMQNGSARELHGWGVMNFIESDDGKPDSFYLARLLEERDSDDFPKMITVFAELERKKISLGVVVIYDMLTDTFLCISDGARSLYIGIDSDKKKIDYFSSLDDTGDDGYSFYGWFISDMIGNISHSEFKYINQYVEKKTATTSSYYGTYGNNRRFDSATQTWITLPTNPLYNWDRDSEDYYYSHPYTTALEARERTIQLPPSGGDGKAPNNIESKATNVGNFQALIVQKEEKVYEIGNTRAKTEIEKSLDKIANGYNAEYDGLNEYSDYVQLDVKLLLETAVFTELEEYFFDRYRHAQERYQKGEKGATFQKLLITIEQCMEAIQDELDVRRDLWVDNFYEIESSKQISDSYIIDTWIENKMDILKFHLADLYT